MPFVFQKLLHCNIEMFTSSSISVLVLELTHHTILYRILLICRGKHPLLQAGYPVNDGCHE